ncbi:hypothetical protein F0U62_16260 [Cystobacter fuscus]|uniref:linalool dehydratase/isomerase domain-containing protein n=1 Tax=Cystobacter fuscus TaxID=43 RepID=UPI002B2F3C6C|nr:hypothetical protein F0U62_16260 [Cystobacter fuscus]
MKTSDGETRASALERRRKSAVTGLDAKQLAYLRHFDNLSRRQRNDWSFMTGRTPNQMDFGGYRFQLAYAAYALALTHVHRLPAAPGALRPTFQRLVAKILEPEVWMYWRDSSRAGGIWNPHLAGRPEQWDPVAHDNIMYSAYVQSMALMYNVLFDDARYAAPGALTLEYFTPFWGDGGKPGGLDRKFEYDQFSLNENLYWQMVRNGYLGIACEPNCVFQICNQPAIIGFRMHDLLTGGSTADEVSRGFRQAWEQFGGPVASNGHLYLYAASDTRTPVPNAGEMPWGDAWYASLANTWNGEFVEKYYASVIGKHVLEGPEGTRTIRPPKPRTFGARPIENDTCDFGWLTVWASEMGDAVTLEGLQRHAERHMRPTVYEGGRFFPRHDEMSDAEGNYTCVEPLTGNVLFAYASLNVPHGLRQLYEQPWAPGHFAEPNLAIVGDAIEVHRAYYDDARATLHFTAGVREDRPGDSVLRLANIWDRGSWELQRDGQVVATGDGQQVNEGRRVEARRTEHLLDLHLVRNELSTYTLSWPGGGA